MRRGYFSLEAFYAAGARRAASKEIDIGLYWRAGRSGPTYRAAWIRDTGEVYVVRHGAPEDGGGRVEVLTCCATEQELHAAFDGWRLVCGRPDSAVWLRERAQRHASRVAGARRAA